MKRCVTSTCERVLLLFVIQLCDDAFALYCAAIVTFLKMKQSSVALIHFFGGEPEFMSNLYTLSTQGLRKWNFLSK